MTDIREKFTAGLLVRVSEELSSRGVEPDDIANAFLVHGVNLLTEARGIDGTRAALVAVVASLDMQEMDVSDMRPQ